MPTTTVSCRGDLIYRDALTMLARTRGVTAGDVVRAALDAYVGADLQNIEDFLRDQSVRRNAHLAQTETKTRGKGRKEHTA